MAICAQAQQQQDGTWLLVLDPATTDFSLCAYVVESGAEFGQGSVTKLSVEDAQVIAGAALLPLAVAWGIKTLAHFLKEFGNESSVS